MTDIVEDGYIDITEWLRSDRPSKRYAYFRLEEAAAEIERLREALRNLLDHQNGPPLGGRFGEKWQAAVDQARAALGEEK